MSEPSPNHRLPSRPPLWWIVVSWLITFVVFFTVMYAAGFIVATTGFILRLNIDAAIAKGAVAWIGFGAGAIAAGLTYLVLRAIGIRIGGPKKP